MRNATDITGSISPQAHLQSLRKLGCALTISGAVGFIAGGLLEGALEWFLGAELNNLGLAKQTLCHVATFAIPTFCFQSVTYFYVLGAEKHKLVFAALDYNPQEEPLLSVGSNRTLVTAVLIPEDRHPSRLPAVAGSGTV